jgi:pimeloyl-ACP methyl ester carboxylesterase
MSFRTLVDFLSLPRLFSYSNSVLSLRRLGKSEFEFVGFCMTWSMENEFHKISIPTLLINGVDEGADDESLQKFQKGVVNSKWVKFTASTHTPHLEEREKFMSVVGEFLAA